MIVNLTPHPIRIYSNERDGYQYIVSLVVALGLADRRSDLLVPYREARNAFGTVIGCRSLARPV